MKQHLKNLAQILMLDKCKELGIDCSGSFVDKFNYGQTYTLRKHETNKLIILITLHQSARPTYLIFDK